MKFNKRYDELNHFVFKDNESYSQAFKAGQPDRLVLCDYNPAETIGKVNAQFEHTRNSKTFAKIKQLYYRINKEMVESLLKSCAVCLNHRNSNTHAPLEPIITSKIVEQVKIDLVDMIS